MASEDLSVEEVGGREGDRCENGANNLLKKLEEQNRYLIANHVIYHVMYAASHVIMLYIVVQAILADKVLMVLG